MAQCILRISKTDITVGETRTMTELGSSHISTIAECVIAALQGRNIIFFASFKTTPCSLDYLYFGNET